LAPAWDPARRAAVAAALGDAAAARLDDYAGSWAAMHRASCEATRAGRQSARALDLRGRCLDRLRGQLGALVERLGAPADPRERARALTAIAGLAPVAACSELERLEA